MVLEQTPLAAQLRLMGCTARNHFSVVPREGELAGFETLCQIAEKQQPRRNQIAGLSYKCAHIRPSRQAGADSVPYSLLRQPAWQLEPVCGGGEEARTRRIPFPEHARPDQADL